MRQYESYKDSGVEWIGKIPSHWDKCRFKNFADLITVPSSSSRKIGLENIESKTGRFISTESEFDGNGVTFSINDVVYGKLRPYLQKVWLAEFEGNAVGDFFVFRSKPNCIPQYLHYLMLSDGFTSECNGATFGAKMPRVPSNFIESLRYYLPPIMEQQAIIAYLDEKTSRIDRIIKSREKKIKLLEELRASIISNAVTKGICKNVEMKESGIDWIGIIPKHWEVRRLKFFAKAFSKGNGITKEEVFPDGDTPCVRYGDIYTKYNGSFERCISKTRRSMHNVARYFNQGDILFAGTGELIEEIGKNIVYLGDTPSLAGGDIIILKHCQDPIFLNYVLNSNYAQSQKSIGKAKLKVVHIAASEIANILVALPSLSEQREIADYLVERSRIIDSQISACQSTIAYLKEYRASLITEVVTGKRKVI